MADVVPINSSVDPWQLERKHERFVRSDVTRGQSEHINMRLSAFHIHRIDKIVQSTIDPKLETRADVMQDAIVMWLEDWDMSHPDGAHGELAAEFKMERDRQQLAARVKFIKDSTETLDEFTEAGDINRIRSFVTYIISQRQNYDGNTPPKLMGQLDSLIEKSRRLIKEALDPQ